MFLMSEGLLEKISDKEFKFNVKEIQNYEFSEVAEGWEAFVKETMPEASKEVLFIFLLLGFFFFLLPSFSSFSLFNSFKKFIIIIFFFS